MTVENSNGSADVSDVTGALTLRDRFGNVTVRTSFSTLRVRIPGDGGYRVTAKTSFGKIRSDLAMNVSGIFSPDSLTGTVGSGECEMRLTNHNGSVEILKAGGR